MNLKNQSYMTMASDLKGEIGYITSSNQQPKLQKVKAAIASIPVGTESLQKLNVLQCESVFHWNIAFSEFKWNLWNKKNLLYFWEKWMLHVI